MRILVLNEAVSGVERVAGEQWFHLRAEFRGNYYPLAATGTNLVDHDVFLFDPDKVDTQQHFGGTQQVNEQITERVSAGGCLILFASAAPLPWLPLSLTPKSPGGELVEIVTNEDTLRTVFERYRNDITYRTQFEHASHWNYIAVARNLFPVSMFARHNHGLILILPEFKNRARVIRVILDKVIPAILPDLTVSIRSVVTEVAPEWVSEFPITEAASLDQEVKKLACQIERLREDREHKEQQRDELLAYQRLLWLDAPPLEVAVEKALKRLLRKSGGLLDG